MCIRDSYYTVHIEVKDGRARFIESPCPDHICEGFGWLSAEDQTATCLPARAVLTWGPKLAAMALLACSYCKLVTGSFNPFIYFRF